MCKNKEREIKVFNQQLAAGNLQRKSFI